MPLGVNQCLLQNTTIKPIRTRCALERSDSREWECGAGKRPDGSLDLWLLNCRVARLAGLSAVCWGGSAQGTSKWLNKNNSFRRVALFIKTASGDADAELNAARRVSPPSSQPANQTR